MDGLHRLEERVEARAAEDPDLGLAHALFSVVDLLESDDDPPPDPSEDEEEEDDDEDDEDDEVFGFERLSVA
jgi:hypothetical protein